MKRGISFVALLILAAPAFGQSSSSTTVTTTTTTTTTSQADYFTGFLLQDASTLPAGQVDLRLRFDWFTSTHAEDAFTLTPALVWGVADGFEFFAEVPVSLGEGGERPGSRNSVRSERMKLQEESRSLSEDLDPDAGDPLLEGNGDTYIGAQWRFFEQEDSVPSMALRGTARIPTAHDSNGVDGELRLILTNDYDSGVRSHLNGFVKTINGDNDAEARDFQWGIVAGVDGPLNSDGSARWVLDYYHASAVHRAESNIHMLEFGSEWTLSDEHKFGLLARVGLDHHRDTPDFGAGIQYSYSIMP
jgi:hypothetical protein